MSNDTKIDVDIDKSDTVELSNPISSTMENVSTQFTTLINGKSLTLDVNQNYVDTSLYVTKADLDSAVKQVKSDFPLHIYNSASDPTINNTVASYVQNKPNTSLVTIGTKHRLTGLFQILDSDLVPLPLGEHAPRNAGGLKADNYGKLYIDFNGADYNVLNSLAEAIGKNNDHFSIVGGKLKVNESKFSTVNYVDTKYNSAITYVDNTKNVMEKAFNQLKTETNTLLDNGKFKNGIELGTSATGNGGYIDFHWNGSSADYTSRIIESANGVISAILGGKTMEFAFIEKTYPHENHSDGSGCAGVKFSNGFCACWGASPNYGSGIGSEHYVYTVKLPTGVHYTNYVPVVTYLGNTTNDGPDNEWIGNYHPVVDGATFQPNNFRVAGDVFAFVWITVGY